MRRTRKVFAPNLLEKEFSKVRAEALRLASWTTQAEPQARRTPFMSIFPTKILLATDGSREEESPATFA